MANLAEAIQQIANMAKPTVLTSQDRGGIDAAVVPEGWELKPLPRDEKLEPRPRRIVAQVRAHDPTSFVAYFNRYKDGNSSVFGNRAEGSFVGIIDYHEDLRNTELAGEGASAPEQARWGEHRVSLVLSKSEEWTLWTAQNGKRMDQEMFSQLLEDNSPDIVDPAPASMIEVARSMTAKTEIHLDSVVRNNKGATFRYNEVTKAGGIGVAGEFSVPDGFTIAIPVYFGAAKVEVKAKLRYQIGNGKLVMWYELWRWQTVERDAFKGVLDQIAGQVSSFVILGQP